MSPLRFLLLVVSPLVLAAAPPADEGQPEPPAYEPFDGKFRLPWKVVRPDAKHWSLAKNKGKLTITTQKGTIHKKAEPNMEKAKNLFLIRNPYGRSADFEVSVCVCDFKPSALWHQAGLLLYDDDDNYLKFVWEIKSDGQGTHLVLIREIDATPEHHHAPAPENTGKVWLRLTRWKDKVEYASSGDGKKWTAHGAVNWGASRGPARVGIMAKNGWTDAPQIDVCFTDFRARSLPPAPAKKD
jgi:regulation of enolase protein 1 (concanavalin A-like superfamily)